MGNIELGVALSDNARTAPIHATALSTDLFTYGVASQRHILETITLYSYEQGLTPRQFALDELFYPPTLEL